MRNVEGGSREDKWNGSQSNIVIKGLSSWPSLLADNASAKYAAHWHVLLFQAPAGPQTIENEYRAQWGTKITPMHGCHRIRRKKISSVMVKFGCYIHITPNYTHTHQSNITNILQLSRHDLCSEVSHCDTIVTQASCRGREIVCQMVTS